MGNRSTFILDTPEEDQKLLAAQAPTGNRDLWRTDNERKIRALRQRGDDAADSFLNQLSSGQQFVTDLFKNAGGLPEATGTVLSGMAAQAGTGLGTGVGMVSDVLRGGVGIGVDRSGNPSFSFKKPDWDAAADVTNQNLERFTMMPKTEGGKAALSGVEQVLAPVDTAMQGAGQAVSDEFDSPALGALTYAGLNMADPEHAAPLIGALRGSKALTGLINEAGPSPGIASTGRRARQSGAWVPGDIAETEGSFQMRSPTVEAFTRLKPQEQKNLSGKQLMKALTREGAKKEELQWMGLDKVLDTDEVMSVADVKRLAEANQPNIEHVQARSSGGAGELDDDAVNEAAREAVDQDDDLQYPIQIMHRAPGSRRLLVYDEAPSSFDSVEEANQWLEEHKEDWVRDRAESNLEDIENILSEEELADMDDDARRDWAQRNAETDVDELLGDFEFENNYDDGPSNYDDLMEYWERRVRESPEDFGLEAPSADAPDYGQYTVGEYGSEPEANYTVAAAKLAGESRFGRNMADWGFLEPYQRAETASAAGLIEPDQQMSLLPEEAKSKAYQREALRRGQIAEDPNRSKYTRQSALSHYRDLGKNQLYFTRETHRPAPAWGTVQKGVGRVSDEGLQTAEAGALPESGDDNPFAFLEEAQSDWYQKGRKTGWADPKDIEKVEKQRVDKEAQVAAFKQQAVGELNNLWTNPQVAPALQRGIANDGYFADLFKKWEGLQPGGEYESSYANLNALQEARIKTGKNILTELEGYSDSPETAQLIQQTRQGLHMMDSMSEIPGAEDLTPTGPMRETPQYTQLAMADALRRAVQEGKQYFGWTPGDVHAHRWGSESMQFAPSAENPRVMKGRFGGGRSMDDQPGTVLEKFQQRADELLGSELDPDMAGDYNLDDPEIVQKLEAAVERHLNYGMSDYPDPQAARSKRAALILKQMEALSAEAVAQGGTRKAAHYSPRAVGYEQAYGPMEKHIIDILRRSGVKPPEIRDIPMRDGSKGSELPMRGFEIDPDLARAAKRGFILPY